RRVGELACDDSPRSQAGEWRSHLAVGLLDAADRVTRHAAVLDEQRRTVGSQPPCDRHLRCNRDTADAAAQNVYDDHYHQGQADQRHDGGERELAKPSATGHITHLRWQTTAWRQAACRAATTTPAST